MKISQYTGLGNNSNISSHDDEERISLFKFALQYGNGYKLGMGIGSILNYSDPNLPDHFGMSEISSKTYEGGLIFLISIILLYSYFTHQLLRQNKKIAILVTLNYIILSTYTTIFTDYNEIFFLCIIVIIYSYKYSQDNSEIES